MSPDSIAKFQSLLLEVLDSQQDASAIHTRLDADISAQIDDRVSKQELVEYIETFDPVMLEIADRLVKKWGRSYDE